MAWNFIVQLALIVVSAIVTNALRPKPEPPKAASLSEFDVPTAEEGRAVPVIFGTVWVKGPNVIWYGDLRSTAIRKRGGKK
jgi:hypothetical protein